MGLETWLFGRSGPSPDPTTRRRLAFLRSAASSSSATNQFLNAITTRCGVRIGLMLPDVGAGHWPRAVVGEFEGPLQTCTPDGLFFGVELIFGCVTLK